MGTGNNPLQSPRKPEEKISEKLPASIDDVIISLHQTRMLTFEIYERFEEHKAPN